jgi:hypothetical protein
MERDAGLGVSGRGNGTQVLVLGLTRPGPVTKFSDWQKYNFWLVLGSCEAGSHAAPILYIRERLVFGWTEQSSTRRISMSRACLQACRFACHGKAEQNKGEIPRVPSTSAYYITPSTHPELRSLSTPPPPLPCVTYPQACYSLFGSSSGLRGGR